MMKKESTQKYREQRCGSYCANWNSMPSFTPLMVQVDLLATRLRKSTIKSQVSLEKFGVEITGILI